jgi:hypothetical protein
MRGDSATSIGPKPSPNPPEEPHLLSPTAESWADLQLILRELERCGWKPATAPAADPVEAFHFPGGVHAPARHLTSDRGAGLMTLDFGDAALAGREDLFPRFLDFPMEARLAMEALHDVAGVGHLLLISREEIVLVRVPQEAVEYRVRSMNEFESEMLPALVAKAGARGDRLQAVPSPMEEAQNLRGWLRHWGRQLSAQLDVTPEDCEKFLWKLILMLQAERRIEPREAPGRWGLRRERRGRDWSLSYDSLSTHEDLRRLLEDFEHTFSTRIFSGDADMHIGWLRSMEETSLAEQLRAELLMQSQLRFEAETVAWLFTDFEREQAGWRRDVAGLEPLSKRLTADGWQVLRPLVCDVQLHGLASALRDADRLAERWADYSAFLSRHEPRGPESRFSQPDFFLGTPRGIGPSGELTDGVNFLFSESLRLTGVPAEDEFGVGLVFLLKALTFPAKLEWPFFGVDTLDRLWRSPDPA